MIVFYNPKLKLQLLFSISCICLFTNLSAQTPAQTRILDHIKHIQSADTASRYVQKLIDQAKQNNDQAFEAVLLVKQSFLIYTKGDETGALKLAQQAKSIVNITDSATWVKARTMEAYMLSRRGDNVNALKVVFEALRATDKHNWRKLSVEADCCVADIYRTINQASKALPYVQKAVATASVLKDTLAYVHAMSDLSNVYSQNEIASAANYEKATRIMELLLAPPYLKLLTPFEQTRYYSNLGRLYSMQNKYLQAETALQKAIDLGEKGKYTVIVVHALNELLTVKIREHQYVQGSAYAERLLTILPLDEMPLKQQYDLYSRLTDLYEDMKNYQKAFKYEKLANDVGNQIMSTNSAAAAAELDDKYRADKRLIMASNQTRLFEQQRNFIIVIASIIVLIVGGIYRWLVYKRKKEAKMLAMEHEQLERIDAMKTRFFNNISHELRTPLTLILGPADVLAEEPELDPELRNSYMQTIRRNSKKLLGMVNELLDLGKIESGNMSLKPRPVQLSNFITVLYQGFASLAEYKKITYSLNCDIDNNVYAEIDREKFEKIINNIISNAIKFTPSGGSINFKAAIVDDNIQIEIADTGKGIQPEDLPHIFDRYYQGNQGKTPEGGTGIGLSIAKEFVLLMGGNISVKSEPNTGTQFGFYIPFMPSAVINEEPAVQAVKYKSAEVQSEQGCKLILLVEDHPEMVSYIASVLQPSYNIITAADGNEALAIMAGANVLPDLIISDVMMPGMDGITLLNKLKEHDIYCRIPALMLTALADKQNKMHALHVGVDDYITKPFLSEELKARVANLLNNAVKRKQTTAEDSQETDKPVIPENNGPSPADLLWLSELETLVRKYTGKTELNLAMLSFDMAISERQLFRRIKAITGLTPNMYIRSIRLQVAREAIESGKYRTIAEISYAAGFETPAYFRKLFKEYYGRDVNDLL